jgi:hypothetical protein
MLSPEARTPGAELANQFRDMEMTGVEDQYPPGVDPNEYLAANGHISWPDGSWDPSQMGYVPNDSNAPPQMHIHEAPVVRQSHDDYHDLISGPNAGHQVNGTSKSGKFKKSRWGFGGMFGGDKMQGPLPPLDELNVASSSSTPSLKRTQSGSTDSHSLPDIQSTVPPPAVPGIDPKKVKKEAERMAKEAEKQRRILAEKAQREQARAVMMKRRQELKAAGEMKLDLEWLDYQRSGVEGARPIKKPPALRYNPVDPGLQFVEEHRRLSDQNDRHKARRRDLDDDHSMSSSDMQSMRMSMISFATVDSDPGPRPGAHRRPPPHSSISRATSYSSLRTPSSHALSPPSARSSTSIESALAHQFSELGSFSATPSSPPPLNHLSISPNGHWSEVNSALNSSHHLMSNGLAQKHSMSSMTLPPFSSFDGLRVPGSPFDYANSSNPSSAGGFSPQLSHINPMFQVVST